MMKLKMTIHLAAMTTLIAVFGLGLPTSVAAQGDRHIDFFIGYGYVRASTGADVGDDVDVDSLNLNGFLAEFSYMVTPKLGLSFEFGGHFGSVDLDVPELGDIINISADLITTMAGPRFKFVDNESVTASVHAFFGVARASLDLDISIPDFPGISIGDDETKFATTIGAAIDWNINEAVAIRVIQPSWLLTTFGDDSQNHFRLGTGVVFRF